MMDYEFRILELEKETRHLREMKDLQRGRLDAHDASLNSIEHILASIGTKLDETVGHLNALAMKVDQLVSVLLRDHPNGKEG